MQDSAPYMFPWQAEVLERALRMQRENRLPHAVLLDTASSHHVDELARYLSMLLLCDKPDGLDLCGSCEACRMMSAGTYADFNRVTLEYDEKSKKLKKNISIEQIRNLIHELSLTRKHDRLKIAVIYPAEAMNKNSANALLKTLEEPAQHVLLVLLTNNPGRVPITLRSRCQLWTIHPPAKTEALQWLQTRGLDCDSAEQYLDFAAGDPLLAQLLQQQDYADQVEAFKLNLGAFLRGRLSASELAKGLAADFAIARRLISMTLQAYCFQASGVDGGTQVNAGSDREKARRLLELRASAQRNLQVEENNLDFQIQLEDVLISLKRILIRRTN